MICHLHDEWQEGFVGKINHVADKVMKQCSPRLCGHWFSFQNLGGGQNILTYNTHVESILCEKSRVRYYHQLVRDTWDVTERRSGNE